MKQSKIPAPPPLPSSPKGLKIQPNPSPALLREERRPRRRSAEFTLDEVDTVSPPKQPTKNPIRPQLDHKPHSDSVAMLHKRAPSPSPDLPQPSRAIHPLRRKASASEFSDLGATLRDRRSLAETAKHKSDGLPRTSTILQQDELEQPLSRRPTHHRQRSEDLSSAQPPRGLEERRLSTPQTPILKRSDGGGENNMVDQLIGLGDDPSLANAAALLLSNKKIMSQLPPQLEAILRAGQAKVNSIWEPILANPDEILVLPVHDAGVRALLEHVLTSDEEQKITIYAITTYGELKNHSIGDIKLFDILRDNPNLAKDLIAKKANFLNCVGPLKKNPDAVQRIIECNAKLAGIRESLKSLLGDKKWTEDSSSKNYFEMTKEFLKSYGPENAPYVLKLIGNGKYNKAIAAFIYTLSAVSRFLIEQYEKEFQENIERLAQSYKNVDRLLNQLIEFDVVISSESEGRKIYQTTSDFHSITFVALEVWHAVIELNKTRSGSNIRSLKDIHSLKVTEQTLNMLEALLTYTIECKELDPEFYYDTDLTYAISNIFKELIDRNLSSASLLGRVMGYFSSQQSNVAFASVPAQTLLHQLRFIGKSVKESDTYVPSAPQHKAALVEDTFNTIYRKMSNGVFEGNKELLDSLLHSLGLTEAAIVDKQNDDPKVQRARCTLKMHLNTMIVKGQNGDIINKKFYDKVIYDLQELEHPKAVETLFPQIANNRNLVNGFISMLSQISDEQLVSPAICSITKAVLSDFRIITTDLESSIVEDSRYKEVKHIILEYLAELDTQTQSSQPLRGDFFDDLIDNLQGVDDRSATEKAKQKGLLRLHSDKISKDLGEGGFVAQNFFTRVYEIDQDGAFCIEDGKEVEDKELNAIMRGVTADITSNAGIKASKIEQRMMGLLNSVTKTIANYFLERFVPSNQYAGFYVALMNLHGFQYLEYLVKRLIAEYEKRMYHEDQKYNIEADRFKSNISELLNTEFITPIVDDKGEIRFIECKQSVKTYTRILATSMRTIAILLDPDIAPLRTRQDDEPYLNNNPERIQEIAQKESAALAKIPTQDRAAIEMLIFNALCENFMIPEAQDGMSCKLIHKTISKITLDIARKVYAALDKSKDGKTYKLNMSIEKLRSKMNKYLSEYREANKQMTIVLRTTIGTFSDSEEISGSSSSSALNSSSSSPDLSSEDETLIVHKNPLDRFKTAATAVIASNRLGTQAPDIVEPLPENTQITALDEIQKKLEGLGMKVTEEAIEEAKAKIRQKRTERKRPLPGELKLAQLKTSVAMQSFSIPKSDAHDVHDSGNAPSPRRRFTEEYKSPRRSEPEDFKIDNDAINDNTPGAIARSLSAQDQVAASPKLRSPSTIRRSRVFSSDYVSPKRTHSQQLEDSRKDTEQSSEVTKK